MEINNKRLKTQINQFWDDHITSSLFDYIKIPNKSPAFDKDWKKNGHMDKVLDMAKSWGEKHLPCGAELLVEEAPGRTPLLLVDIPGTKSGNILMYGHLDKQPEMEGWSAPKTSDWLAKAIEKASLNHFDERDCSMSEGGTIPFMAMLGEKYPEAQFVITGVLGPNSNAHGPNEFLHIPYAKKLTCCIASIINDFN